MRWEDLTPKLSGLYAELEKIKENTLLVPLSEHLRIDNSKCEAVLKQIINVQYNHDIYSAKAHLYIPMYRMKDSLQLLLAKDPRLTNNIIFLESKEDEDDYSLTIISKEVKSFPFQGNILKGYKSYLIYWEENPSKPIILYTGNAIAYQQYILR